MTTLHSWALCCLLLGQANAADRSLDQTTAEQLKAFAELATKEVAQMKAIGENDSQPKLVLREAPILRYTNPISGSMNGNVFVWTAGTRVEIIAAVFQFPGRPLSVECHSLAERRVELVRDDGVAWRPAGPGVELRAVARAAEPSPTRGGRLAQMRELARQFAAERTDPDGQKLALRLLTQPIYRYSDGDDNVRDGALFAFVEGTNPDVILVLEDRKSTTGRGWQFAAARLHHRQMRLTHHDKEVWTVRQLTNAEKSIPDQPYYIFRR